MSHHKLGFLATLALLSALTCFSGESVAQCGGGNRASTGSTTALNSSLTYPSNPLVSNGYPPATGMLALAYQQRVLATQQQLASMMYQNAERQRLAASNRDQIARPYRLARAEAKRDARAARTAERLRQQEHSSNAYLFASVNAPQS